MKKVFSLALAVAVTFAGKAHALVGGPFDNGNYSKAMEASGTYQATYTFKNGSGFVYFTTNNTLRPSITPGATPGTASSPALASLGTSNRSIIYYKGLVYAGMATGTSDLLAGQITGYSNGSSDVGTSVSTSSSSGGSSVNETAVSSGGHNYIASSNWKAKVIGRTPSIRFSGNGDLAIVSPDGFAAISAALNTAITATYNALRTQATTPASALANAVTSNFATVGGAMSGGYSTNFIPEHTVPAHPEGQPPVLVPAVTTPATTYSKDLATLAADLAMYQSIYAAAQAGALANLNSINDATASKLNSLLAAQSAALKDALTPTSADDLDKKYTEHVKIKVSGYLKYN